LHDLAENTIIIFTSDNGFSFGVHKMAGRWLLRESSLRVPGFVFDPRLPQKQRGRRLQEQIITPDFTATLLDIADIEPRPTYREQAFGHQHMSSPN
jgi:arylsulfatase A-like enzyme